MNSKKISCLLELSSKIDVSDFGAKTGRNHKTYVATMLKNIEDLGFTFSRKLVNKLVLMSEKELHDLYNEIVPVLKRMKGAHVTHKPMYPNFPTQVMEASDAELYLNAIFHYISVVFGESWLPNYEKVERSPLIGNHKLKLIGLAEKGDYAKAIDDLIHSSIALSETHRNYIKDFYAENKKDFKPTNISNKEILAFVAGMLYSDKNILTLEGLFKTPTDVLRFITALSDGDVSLADNTKFLKMPRGQRKMVLNILEGMTHLSENMVKHRNKWIRVAEKLHPGEFKTRFPKSFAAFKNLRSGETIETFYTNIEKLYSEGKYLKCATELASRPTDLARRLDALVRNARQKDGIVDVFKKVASKVSTPVLLNVRSHFQSRTEQSDTRMFFPKGNLAKVQVIKNDLKPLDKAICGKIVKIAGKALINRFGEMPSLGKVYIDETLKGINVPFALRSASNSFKTVARGSRIAIPGDKKVVRLFTWWKNGVKPGMKAETDSYYGDRIDIDLSVMFLDDKFSDAGHVSWTNLRWGGGEDSVSAHSGDITDAPKGASEFIDIDIEKALKKGIRYVAVNVHAFTTQTFDTMKECFAGVMLRDNLKSGEIYDPKTVEHKFDLTAAATTAIPMIFDLQTRELIWLDLTLNNKMSYMGWGQTVEGNKKSLATIVQGIVDLNKPTLYDLFKLHAEGRGKVVTDKKKADKVYDLEYTLNSLPEILTML
jgi:stress response protein SCP2